MNKMVINRHGKLFVTNDAATIIRELDVVHPAAKMCVMASEQQQAEVSVPTGSVTQTVFRLGMPQTSWSS